MWSCPPSDNYSLELSYSEGCLNGGLPPDKVAPFPLKVIRVWKLPVLNGLLDPSQSHCATTIISLWLGVHCLRCVNTLFECFLPQGSAESVVSLRGPQKSVANWTLISWCQREELIHDHPGWDCGKACEISPASFTCFLGNLPYSFLPVLMELVIWDQCSFPEFPIGRTASVW